MEVENYNVSFHRIHPQRPAQHAISKLDGKRNETRSTAIPNLYIFQSKGCASPPSKQLQVRAFRRKLVPVYAQSTEQFRRYGLSATRKIRDGKGEEEACLTRFSKADPQLAL